MWIGSFKKGVDNIFPAKFSKTVCFMTLSDRYHVDPSAQCVTDFVIDVDTNSNIATPWLSIHLDRYH